MADGLHSFSERFQASGNGESLAHMQFMFKHPLEASVLLKPGRNEEEAKQWLAMIFKAHSHLSAAMVVMHP
ncbi:hypothetical protein PAXRUDRAFT_19650 [Paxillus rubicundulus Ve08.2h10]|uniref:Unplaced genomic scaffold scaffold_3838, whole genome shotgun sequence n=1 Tax=Paxillus rubicundulus Ve08.2h10 TaxID=930991 RepID=A0A0D0DBM3_9AGAM|nr:hypothetical protein PAXRUDRAFT_19650 [Paxillus rubicundulus Ve08.2h10]